MPEETITRKQFELFKSDVEGAYNRLEDKIAKVEKEIGTLRSRGH